MTRADASRSWPSVYFKSQDWEYEKASATQNAAQPCGLPAIYWKPVMSLTFDDYLTADWTETWDNPIDLRYLFDALAPWPGLCWVLRGDPEHLRPQLSGMSAFDWQAETPIEVRLIETPNIDVFTFDMVLAELNKRNRLDARLEEIHLCCYQRLVEKLPAINVPYVGRA